MGDLVGISEIRDILATMGREVSRQRVDQLTRTEWFPAPQYILRQGRIWTRTAVQAALDQHPADMPTDHPAGT